MILELLLQLLAELARALLVDELSRRVRSLARRSGDMRGAIMKVHHHNRQRLLNRLLTEEPDDP